MGHILSEGLENIGRIDDSGYVFDRSGTCIAKINNAGYIGKVGGGETYGKIDTDGTIRDASNTTVGRIQADGYVYIHSQRVCHVSSAFLEKITPDAWNAGNPSTYSGRERTREYKASSYKSSGSAFGFFTSSFFIKLVIGIVLGIIAMVNGWGGIEMLLVGPGVVFLVTLIAKIFGN